MIEEAIHRLSKMAACLFLVGVGILISSVGGTSAHAGPGLPLPAPMNSPCESACTQKMGPCINACGDKKWKECMTGCGHTSSCRHHCENELHTCMHECATKNKECKKAC